MSATTWISPGKTRKHDQTAPQFHHPVPDFDVAIAATAFALGRTLVSSDQHMTAIDGLPLEDWTV